MPFSDSLPGAGAGRHHWHLYAVPPGTRALQLMGVCEELAGLIIGKPEHFSAQGAPFGYEELILEIIGHHPYPIVSNFDYSHTHPMLTLAQRTRLSLVVAEGYEVSVTVEEPMIASQ